MLPVSPAAPSTPDSPDQENLPTKRSFSISMNETEFPDESRNLQYGDNITYNG